MTQTNAGPIDAEFAERFLARIKENFEARDVDALLEMSTEDLVYDDMGHENSLDRDGLMTMWKPIFGAMTSARAELLGAFLGTDGRTVAGRWRFTMQRPDVVEPVVVETVGIYSFRGDKVSRWTTLFRNLDWMGDLWP